MEVTFSGLESWLGAAVFLIVSHLEVSSITQSQLVTQMLMVHVRYSLSSPVYDYCVLSPSWQVNSLLGRLSGHAKILNGIPARISIQWWFLPEPPFTTMVASDLAALVLAQHLSFGSWCSAAGERPPSSPFIHLSIHCKEMGKRWLYFSGLQNHCRRWLQPWN